MKKMNKNEKMKKEQKEKKGEKKRTYPPLLVTVGGFHPESTLHIQRIQECARNHGSRMRRALKCTLKSIEPIRAFHGSGNDLSSKTPAPRVP